MNDSLQRHDILGQKWGVRRYQNYDGSYTQKGLAHYRKSKENYESAKENYCSTKRQYKSGVGSKQDVREARSSYKNAKRAMNKSYDKLRDDKLADEGKELYSKGKRILVNQKREAQLTTATTIADAAVTYLATKSKTVSTRYGNLPVGTIAPAAVTLGGATVGVILGAKNSHTNKRLRAYYRHHS